MEKPSSVNRRLVGMAAYGEHVVAQFAFSADFRSTSVTLAATLSIHADKATSFRDIEKMANKMFMDILQATLAKGSEEISQI
jgi:hypothetical protein